MCWINYITHPFLAASPNRICHCECHGKFVFEIKCPFRVSGLKIKEYSLKNKDCFLKVHPSTGNMYLEKDHEYLLPDTTSNIRSRIQRSGTCCFQR